MSNIPTRSFDYMSEQMQKIVANVVKSANQSSSKSSETFLNLQDSFQRPFKQSLATGKYSYIGMGLFKEADSPIDLGRIWVKKDIIDPKTGNKEEWLVVYTNDEDELIRQVAREGLKELSKAASLEKTAAEPNPKNIPLTPGLKSKNITMDETGGGGTAKVTLEFTDPNKGLEFYQNQPEGQSEKKEEKLQVQNALPQAPPAVNQFQNQIPQVSKLKSSIQSLSKFGNKSVIIYEEIHPNTLKYAFIDELNQRVELPWRERIKLGSLFERPDSNELLKVISYKSVRYSDIDDLIQSLLEKEVPGELLENDDKNADENTKFDLVEKDKDSGRNQALDEEVEEYENELPEEFKDKAKEIIETLVDVIDNPNTDVEIHESVTGEDLDEEEDKESKENEIDKNSKESSLKEGGKRLSNWIKFIKPFTCDIENYGGSYTIPKGWEGEIIEENSKGYYVELWDLPYEGQDGASADYITIDKKDENKVWKFIPEEETQFHNLKNGKKSSLKKKAIDRKKAQEMIDDFRENFKGEFIPTRGNITEFFDREFPYVDAGTRKYVVDKLIDLIDKSSSDLDSIANKIINASLQKEAHVVEENGKWYVYNKDKTKKLSKGYSSKEQAIKRLRQIEFFKHQSSFNRIADTGDAQLVPMFLKLKKLLAKRKENPEDIDIHDQLGAYLYEIFIKAGIPRKEVDTVKGSIMEDDMYSGEYNPQEVIEYTKDMIKEWKQDLGIKNSSQKIADFNTDNFFDTGDSNDFGSEEDKPILKRAPDEKELDEIKDIIWYEMSVLNNRWSGIEKALRNGGYNDEWPDIDFNEEVIKDIKSFINYRIEMANQMVNSSLKFSADISDNVPPMGWTDSESHSNVPYGAGPALNQNPALQNSNPASDTEQSNVLYDSNSDQGPKFQTTVNPKNKSVEIKFLDSEEEQKLQNALNKPQVPSQTPVVNTVPQQRVPKSNFEDLETQSQF